MKKLLIATGLLSALVVTGCATNPASTTDESATPAYGHNHQDMHHHGESFKADYQCNNNAKVSAIYNPDAENSVLTITAPTLKLNGAQITAQLAPSGSGVRFINQPSANTLYDWHTKGTMGMLNVTLNGIEHTFECHSPTPAHHH